MKKSLVFNENSPVSTIRLSQFLSASLVVDTVSSTCTCTLLKEVLEKTGVAFKLLEP